MPSKAELQIPVGETFAAASSSLRRIPNIISPAHTPDPAVVWHEGYYYAVRSKIEVSPSNTDPDGWHCWHGAQDQVIINRARRLEDVFTRPEASSIIIDRSSPFGGGWGGVSVGAYQISYQPGAGCPSAGFWAPALRHINGRWFLFITGHRLDFPGESNFVLENTGSGDIMDVDSWVYRGMVNHHPPGLDGEPLVLPTGDPNAASVTLRDNGKTIKGQLYFVYSHNEASQSGTQQLNLAKLQWDNSTFEEYDTDKKEMMSYTRAFSVAGEAAISFPTLDWEGQRCSGCGSSVNEGPTALYGPISTFVLYSASFCATKYYTIGMLEFIGVGDGFPYIWAKHPRPVFSGDVFLNDKLVGTRPDAFGIGHNQVTTSPDLSEQWIVYHAKRWEAEGPADRETRVQRFGWRVDGRPDFGNGPSGRGAMIPAPSEAENYALVCSEPEYKGRFCVGLLPGRYGVNELAVKGIDPAAMRSVRLYGAARARALTSSFSVNNNTGSNDEVLWSAVNNMPVLPDVSTYHGAVLKGVEVEVPTEALATF